MELQFHDLAGQKIRCVEYPAPDDYGQFDDALTWLQLDNEWVEIEAESSWDDAGLTIKYITRDEVARRWTLAEEREARATRDKIRRARIPYWLSFDAELAAEYETERRARLTPFARLFEDEYRVAAEDMRTDFNRTVFGGGDVLASARESFVGNSFTIPVAPRRRPRARRS